MHRAALYEHETTWSETPSVVYTPCDDGTHGNFFPAAYKRILANAAWKERLGKSYTASARVPHAESRHRHELDCAASSDALLMNIFCHPQTVRSPRLARLLGTTGRPPDFGVRARVPLLSEHDDRTEFDMRLDTNDGPLYVEAKLSESDFQTARPELLNRYSGFDEIFDVDQLPRSRMLFRSYQLLRCILAAQHLGGGFAVFLDSRRNDLMEDVFLVYRAVRPLHLRNRLRIVTWQELACCVSRNLQAFLATKYGIEPCA